MLGCFSSMHKALGSICSPGKKGKVGKGKREEDRRGKKMGGGERREERVRDNRGGERTGEARREEEKEEGKKRILL